MAIQLPKLIDIERTILLFKEVGALSDLTYADRIMASLLLDARLSKLILLANAKWWIASGKLKECVIIAAGLSTKNIFSVY